VTETGEPATHHSGCRIPPLNPTSRAWRVQRHSTVLEPKQARRPLLAHTPGPASRPSCNTGFRSASTGKPASASRIESPKPERSGRAMARDSQRPSRPETDQGVPTDEAKLQRPPKRTGAQPRGRSQSTPKCAKDATSPVPLPAQHAAEATQPHGSQPSTTSHRSAGTWGQPGCRVSPAGS